MGQHHPRPLWKAFDRVRRLTTTEIASLDRVFRETPEIGVAWSWAYGGEVMYANNYDYDAVWERVAELGAGLDEARTAVWEAAAAASVPGADDPRRAELACRWTSVRTNATHSRWAEAAREVLAVPGPIWGAALAVEVAVLVFIGGHLDPERALLRPWEAVIETLPDCYRWSPESWPWGWPPRQILKA